MDSTSVEKLFLYFFLLTLQRLASADPPYCDSTVENAMDHSYFRTLNALLGSLTSASDKTKFNVTTKQSEGRNIYGMFLCYGLITNENCRNCVEAAEVQILSPLILSSPGCQNKTELVVYEEECHVRYSGQNFQGKVELSKQLPFVGVKNHIDMAKFGLFVNRTLYKLAEGTAFDAVRAFYKTMEVKFTDGDPFYFLMQCTPDLVPQQCHKCLKAAIVSLDTKFGLEYTGARVYSRNCFLRYEGYPIPNSGVVGAKGKKKKILIKIVAGILSVLLVAILAFAIYAYRSQRSKKRKKEIMRKNRLANVIDVEDSDMKAQEFDGGVDLKNQKFFIDLPTLRAATLDFSPCSKLGQGGFGPVYKGKMRDGTEIAVKRLENHSDQGMAEFVNEIQLILKLQHKNLVRLLGFSVDGKERLLVYELMRNGGLDTILFDRKKRAQLNWNKRVNIIKGIAKGLLYLHQDSRLHIIHRDLKVGNILLDEEMVPKISDFGIARIVAGNDCNTTGVIIGTYGYMAPEYAMDGLYSVKSDVYSFGILLMEIITGRKNTESPHPQRPASLLAHVWQLWREGNVWKAMEPWVAATCPPKEFLKLAQIGLLCVQQDMSDRPTMSSVVVMLEEESMACLSEPKRPAFSYFKSSNNHGGRSTDVSASNLTISTLSPR